jgi:hypothetical protein
MANALGLSAIARLASVDAWTPATNDITTEALPAETLSGLLGETQGALRATT